VYVAAGVDEANVLTCRRSNEKQSPITHEKRPSQRAGSNFQGTGMGSMQGIQVPGPFGRDRQMDKFLYREEINRFRQNNRMRVSCGLMVDPSSPELMPARAGLKQKPG
jgi:hypothetical protein